jgi:zeaxanthin glucosyltransferase
MIIFPCGVDQPGNAARVRHLQVGLTGDIREVMPQLIDKMVETILDDSTYRGNVVRMSKFLQTNNTCDEALLLIERALAPRMKD